MSARPPVVVERSYAAEPERVFEAWSDLDQLTQWWGCATDTLWIVDEWDLREGGAIRVHQTFDGNLFEAAGAFTRIEPNRSLAFDWDADQHIVVTIEEADEGSTMRIEHHGLPNEMMDGVVTEGWGASVVQIEAVLA